MAGSRTEAIGSIFTRVTGLLKSGALKEIDKPVWYDVMAAFPPKIEPKYDRIIDTRKTIDIVYHEDNIRAKFYKTYGNPRPVNLLDINEITVCSRFMEKYKKLENQHETEESCTDEVVRRLNAEGIQLKSMEEIYKERREKHLLALERQKAEIESMKQPVTASEIFGATSLDEISADMSLSNFHENKDAETVESEDDEEDYYSD